MKVSKIESIYPFFNFPNPLKFEPTFLGPSKGILECSFPLTCMLFAKFHLIWDRMSNKKRELLFYVKFMVMSPTTYMCIELLDKTQLNNPRWSIMLPLNKQF
jgi:hypothetical protein